jgi:hypothetical protein
MKRIAFAFIGLLLPFINFSQSCLPDGIDIVSQAQIDNFHANYPGCNEIQGYVNIIGVGITNLNGLLGLTKIGGDFYILSTSIQPDLQGLDSLIQVGGYFDITDNNALISLDGLEGLTSVNTDLTISLNQSLSSISGLKNLTNMRNLALIGNPALTSLSGLENISSIQYDLRIESQNVPDLESLNNLNTIGRDLKIQGNHVLTNLSGLNSLANVGNMVTIKTNSNLINLDGLQNLKTVKLFYILGNGMLNDISALENLGFITGTRYSEFKIAGNSSLSDCAVKSLCIGLNNTNLLVTINTNAPGCNTKVEVDSACGDLTVKTLAFSDSFSYYPNPTEGKITIESNTSAFKDRLILYNINGNELLQCRFTGLKTTIDIVDFPDGIYFLKLITDQWVTVEKIIKN